MEKNIIDIIEEINTTQYLSNNKLSNKEKNALYNFYNKKITKKELIKIFMVNNEN